MEPATTRPTNHRGKRVLCIEDEYFISELYARAFKKGGYDADFETDGQKGLAKAQTNQYDIILIDLMVPTIDGIEILHTLRDPAKTPQLKAKVIIITNLEQREEVRGDIERQADGYLIKAEITPHELVEFLDHLDV
ncbi:MAG TPA: response regulator [Candidatus Saccharimonadales bacterium]|nr:response regulator [Candidatus Saccharimonadales bacterium]